MITVEDALSRVLALAESADGEVLSLEQAAGRALLAPATAQLTQPPFDAAAMDGYALRAQDIGQSLRVIGESAAGHPWTGQPAPGTAIRIFTGAPVPAGYDQVVMQEMTRRDGEMLTVTEPPRGSHIRPRGGDFALGDSLAPGRLLTAADIGLLAAMNIPEVTVARRPSVAILAGGDELVRPGQTPKEGQIISSNDLAIAALATEAGALPTILPIARDSLESLRDRFRQAATADLIVTIGGASVGDHDLIARVAEELGMERAFYKLAMRPGKPLMAGRIGRSAMLGLPGNPVSAITCGILFMQPLIRRMQGLPVGNRLHRARLAIDIPAEGDRQHYLRARLEPGGDLPAIAPFEDQDSAKLSLMSQADALLFRPAHDAPRGAGEIVDYLPLRGGN
ncbi:gephyrin-like molybdotransferase Glp [Paracoccus fistulariae]|uniref:Molybdopterin molybdenumtransferase n=1 Tax=Paracoccus fistulariae TaxID=658446 RepID=A0ABY7SKA3_9RHOB|nr:gephyrin-like molybdotransferase Glp [Paracoccus fistulariae]MDB6181396.1 molybdopterin molybdotransferase MoeA [Paracoccus fistulariae]WCR07440.1 molybdopterin molybdotransferase MoeA [Paracoccus fistulariae]